MSWFASIVHAADSTAGSGFIGRRGADGEERPGFVEIRAVKFEETLVGPFRDGAFVLGEITGQETGGHVVEPPVEVVAGFAHRLLYEVA